MNNHNIQILKSLLKDTKDKLKIKFNKSVNDYWENKMKKILINDSASMFAQVNQIYRKKDISNYPSHT